WFFDAFSYLNVDLGPHWKDLLTVWVQFERLSNWVKKPSKNPRAFPALFRPKELTHWISNCRYERKGAEPTFETTSLGPFIDQFWSWWTSMQPGWRPLDAGNKPAPITSYGSDWKVLSVCGKNGWLSVLACLKWWGLHVANVGDGKDRWLEALTDVLQMLRGVVQYHTTQKTT
ncbi:hypothetical protein FB446DRAFT_630977, partial [Lentinula raphanica]